MLSASTDPASTVNANSSAGSGPSRSSTNTLRHGCAGGVAVVAAGAGETVPGSVTEAILTDAAALPFVRTHPEAA